MVKENRMRTHRCACCGNETEGNYTPGGQRWAICESCMTSQWEANREKRDHWKREEEARRRRQKQVRFL